MATDVASGVVSAARRDVNSGVSSPRNTTGDNRTEEDRDEDNEEARLTERHSLLEPAAREPETPTSEVGAPLFLEKMDVDLEDDDKGTLVLPWITAYFLPGGVTRWMRYSAGVQRECVWLFLDASR